jgi:hypothetical protein
MKGDEAARRMEDLVQPFSPLEPIPYGYCHCRCGGLTTIAKKNDPHKGWIKGEPIRFIGGHNMRKELATTFWSQVDRTTTPDGCWLFTGDRTPEGYGRIWVNGKTRLAHHIVLEFAGRVVPDGLQVNHLCDNPPCVRLDHLVFGTSQDDADDRVLSGRHAHGERGGSAKLTDALALEILALYQHGVRGHGYRVLAKRFGVAIRTIRNVLRGDSWQHITRQAKQ